MAVLLPLAALVFAVAVLAVKAWPAIRVNGWYFLYGKNWTYGQSYGAAVHTDGVAHAAGSQFGAWPIILGHPPVVGHRHHRRRPALDRRRLRADRAPPGWISRPLGLAIEILAGIPSVVIGLWGILTFGPWLAKHVYPILPASPTTCPTSGPSTTSAALSARVRACSRPGIVLGMMIVPIITSTTRDLFLQVPPLPKEGGEALGMTNWEVANRITLPWVRSGIIGATVLGLGRALGETIAVAHDRRGLTPHRAQHLPALRRPSPPRSSPSSTARSPTAPASPWPRWPSWLSCWP